MNKANINLLLGFGLGMSITSIVNIPYSNIIGWVLVGVALVLMFQK